MPSPDSRIEKLAAAISSAGGDPLAASVWLALIESAGLLVLDPNDESTRDRAVDGIHASDERITPTTAHRAMVAALAALAGDSRG